jgi:hypothetical protein
MSKTSMVDVIFLEKRKEIFYVIGVIFIGQNKETFAYLCNICCKK